MDRSTARRGQARCSTLLVLLFASTALLAGCPGPEEVPPDASRPERDAAIDALVVRDTGPLDAGTDAPAIDAFTPDAPGLDAFSATPDAFDCVAPEGCYRCAPTTSEQFLDRCTSATCEPFVNDRTRLPLLNADGTLPALP